MVDDAEIARLIGESLAAHARMLHASNARAEALIIRNAREALAALIAAVALDPGRTAPAWTAIPRREQVAVSNRMLPFYHQIDAEGVAQGI